LYLINKSIIGWCGVDRERERGSWGLKPLFGYNVNEK